MAGRLRLALSLIVAVYFIAFDGVHGSRLAVEKCSEYRNLKINKCPPKELILTPRIKSGEFPHQALLGYEKPDGTVEFQCGGVLISKRYVLTVAHCLSNHDQPTVVRLGEVNILQKGDERDVPIESIIIHPNYLRSQFYNDIALIKLHQDVQFTRSIRPACLWTENTFNQSSATTTSFSQTTEFEKESLIELPTKILDKSHCAHFTENLRRLKNGWADHFICTESSKENDGVDGCLRNSGDPLQVPADEGSCIYHLLGLSSFGSCGSPIGVYISVPSFIDWIEQTVWK
ncbi:serine protease snake-like [Uranotaenia lowii]|uniref:serine protease snake-like n=1 Tax=Uranotaenia lowii TaxID=190385 RepID=UPI00247A37E5|nr:serine protease snake-like [Uranotaenia lowii]